MKIYTNSICLLPLLALLPGIPATGSAEEAAARTTTVAVVASTESRSTVPQSIFVIPASPKEGRNPFFPRSKTEAPVVTQKADSVEAGSIVLNGLTSPPKKTAMINGKTFEEGEAGEVKCPNGARVSIQCLEIRDNAAIIIVGSQRRELRLRGGI